MTEAKDNRLDPLRRALRNLAKLTPRNLDVGKGVIKDDILAMARAWKELDQNHVHAVGEVNSLELQLSEDAAYEEDWKTLRDLLYDVERDLKTMDEVMLWLRDHDAET